MCIPRIAPPLTAVLLAVAVAAPSLSAQDRPTATAGRVTAEVRLDGRLDESDWAQAPLLGPLTMVEPVEGGRLQAETEVRIIADARTLYIGIRAFDPDPAGIVSFAKARDPELRSEDHVKVILDPYGDGRSGYIFAINPGGARYDGLVADQGTGENSDWDAAWEARTRRDGEGWTAEIRIPVQSLTFDSSLDEWGFNFERRVQRTLEVSRWAGPSRDALVTQTSRAGRLLGLPDFDNGLGLTVRPSVTVGTTKDGPDAAWAGDSDASLDVLQRVGSNVTAVATFNTDFAETEVDTRRTNLTRFPLFFPEKRTFFLDGADIFDFGAGMETFHRQDLVPFFTRRIGLFEGEQVPIRGGAKISGRAGRTNFGGLITRTGAVDGLVDATTLGAFRVRQNVFSESTAGVLTSFGDPQGRSGSFTVGGDFIYRTSRFRGSQNMTAAFWGMATNRDDLSGDRTAFGAYVDLPNDPWDLWVSYKRIGESFDPSLGFVPRRFVHLGNLGVNYRLWSPWSGVRNFFFELVPIFAWDLTGRLESYRIFTAPVNVRLESGDRIEFNVQPQGERLPAPFKIADGIVIPAGSYDWLRYRLEVDFAAKRALSGRVSWWFGPFYDGDVSELSVSAQIKPSDLLTFEVSATRNDGSLPVGDFLQEIVGGRVRLNVSPDLQVSSYVQYERESGELGTNTRLRWTFDPLGDLFVVYNYNALDEDLGWTLDSSQLLVKIQYAFRR